MYGCERKNDCGRNTPKLKHKEKDEYVHLKTSHWKTHKCVVCFIIMKTLYSSKAAVRFTLSTAASSTPNQERPGVIVSTQHSHDNGSGSIPCPEKVQSDSIIIILLVFFHSVNNTRNNATRTLRSFFIKFINERSLNGRFR